MKLILEALQYDFIQRAILVGSLIAISSSFLGIFLVLKKQSMIGGWLSSCKLCYYCHCTIFK